jgi:hypothetical protein
MNKSDMQKAFELLKLQKSLKGKINKAYNEKIFEKEEIEKKQKPITDKLEKQTKAIQDSSAENLKAVNSITKAIEDSKDEIVQLATQHLNAINNEDDEENVLPRDGVPGNDLPVYNLDENCDQNILNNFINPFTNNLQVYDLPTIVLQTYSKNEVNNLYDELLDFNKKLGQFAANRIKKYTKEEKEQLKTIQQHVIKPYMNAIKNIKDNYDNFNRPKFKITEIPPGLNRLSPAKQVTQNVKHSSSSMEDSDESTDLSPLSYIPVVPISPFHSSLDLSKSSNMGENQDYSDDYQDSSESFSGTTGQGAGNLLVYKSKHDLWKRLRLLIGERMAGNTSLVLRNNIVVIIEELKKLKDLTRFEYKTLYNRYLQ